MCGIAGIVDLVANGPVDRERLIRMRDALRHRGPDGAGLYAEGPVGLGHRRLAIVDVAGGAQPLSNEDGSVWVACNGEVYNHPELRPRLERAGHRYRTRSDTETILHLYEEAAERCVERLEGMFAFALWDVSRRRLLLARDRLGIKPLYYAVAGERLYFASEIKAILAGGAVRAELDREVLPEYLAGRFLGGERTFFRGVRKLLPGRILTWSREEGVRVSRYWRPPVGETGNGTGCDPRALRERLEEAVRSHLMSDVPLGLFLSGGVDSSALLGLMSRMMRERVRTFAVGFDEPGGSELPYARLAAREAGAEHREVVVSRDAFFDALPRLIWHEDEPLAFSSSVPLYFLSCLARRHVKVVLTGEGSDELFLGYSRYRIAAWDAGLDRWLWSRVPATAREGIRRAVNGGSTRLAQLAARTFLGAAPGDRSRLFDNFAVFSARLQRKLLADSAAPDRHDPYACVLGLAREAGGGAAERMAYADLQTYLVELLMKQDQMSMAASIETRVPYLDHRLVEYAATIPAARKLRGFRTKAVLRDAVADLVPRAILSRRKMGFPVPLSRWLRLDRTRAVEEYLLAPRVAARGLFDPGGVRRLAQEHRRGLADHGERLWLLINLELWLRIFVDGEDVRAARPTAA